MISEREHRVSVPPTGGLVALCAGLLAIGCGSTGVESSWHPPAAHESARVMQILEQQMPLRSRQVHRLLVRGAGRETLLTGHLELDRMAGFRAVAIDELGGPAFAFFGCRERSEVVEAPQGVDRQLLLRGPVADLALAFLLPESAPGAMAVTGDVILARWQRERLQRECTFDMTAGRVLGCQESLDGRRLRRLSYSYGAAGEGDSLTAVSVHDLALHFSMEIEILELSPLSPTAGDRNWCDPD